MPDNIQILPVRVILVGFDGAQGLDVFGPAEVFAAANRSLGRSEYRVVLAAVGGGRVRSTSGIGVRAQALERLVPRRQDTVLVVGGERQAIRAAIASAPLRRWLTRAARCVRRFGSVCSGAFVLAAAGLLDGRRAATHWSVCRELSLFRPQISVDADAIFVRDGSVWTSAGVTTGIDMALALVEEDCGRGVADSAAARLVVYARRPGFQSQFSETLIAQSESSDSLARGLELIRRRPTAKLSVIELAHAVGMSVRSLHRRCREEFGATPAKLIERLRTENARLLISTTPLEAKVVAARSGFENPARMARAFRRTLGMSPRAYRALFAERTPSATAPDVLGKKRQKRSVQA
ncbi:MAG TPA: helix-turn-helix domain-containing protein [Polyangiaceae bacterium]|nr:helix-turn-helix domain-containing protein [Polyangiaceae bacterium]